VLLNYYIGSSVLGSLCVGDLVWLGWSGIHVAVSSLQHEHYSNPVTPNLQHTADREQNYRCSNSTAQSQAPDDGYTEWRKKNACFRYLPVISFLGLPQIRSLRSKTSYIRRSESFHSRRNCNCATRNVSKCDAELLGEAPDVCTATRTPSFRYDFP